MISLIIVFVMLVPVYMIAIKQNKIDSVTTLVSFFVSAVAGIVLDHFLGIMVGWWYYTNIPYLSITYWLLIPFAWGIFGIWVYSLFGILQGVTRKFLTSGVIVTFVIGGISEYMTVVRDIWRYNAPLWLIIFGWFMLVFGIVVTTLLINRNIVWRKAKNVKTLKGFTTISDS